MDSVVFLQNEFPGMVEDMHQASHHYNHENLNPYHLEGDVWAHQMMVSGQVRDRDFGRVVNIAALCHDLGKPACRDPRHDTKRVRFFGHEGVSVFMGAEVLRKMDDKSFLSFTDEVKQEILELVSWHTDLFSEIDEFDNVAPKMLNRFAGQSMEQIRHWLELMVADGAGRFVENHRELDVEHIINQFHEVNRLWKENRKPGRGHPTLFVLIGPPLAGKSTWCNSHAPEAFTVSRDDVMMGLAGNGMTYDEAWNHVDPKKTDKIVDLVWKAAKKSGRDIVVDMTNMSRKSRKKWLNGLPKNMETVAIVFATPFNVLEARNHARSMDGKSIPPGVLLNMMKRFSAPTLTEFNNVEWVF